MTLAPLEQRCTLLVVDLAHVNSKNKTSYYMQCIVFQKSNEERILQVNGEFFVAVPLGIIQYVVQLSRQCLMVI